MLVTYELYDKEGEPLMSMLGKEYIAPVNSGVLFYDTAKNKKDFIALEFIGKVTHHLYNVSANSIQISCETIYELTEREESKVSKYHELKFKKQC